MNGFFQEILVAEQDVDPPVPTKVPTSRREKKIDPSPHALGCPIQRCTRCGGTLDWKAFTPNPCRNPFGMAGAPMSPAAAMNSFTRRQAVVRLQLQIRLKAKSGSRWLRRILK